MIDWDRVIRLLKVAALEEYMATGTLNKKAAELFPVVVQERKYRTRSKVLYYVRLTHRSAGDVYKVGVTKKNTSDRFRSLYGWKVEVIFEQAYEHVAHALQLEEFIKVLGAPYLIPDEDWKRLPRRELIGKTETFVCDVLAARPDDESLDYWLQDNAAALLYEQLKQAGAPC